jgi:CheY-like chemotaxis protein
MSDETERKPIILLADDDPDDQLLIREAFEEGGIELGLECVNDGEELMDFLYRQGDYVSRKADPYPVLVLLDLNMPRKDGREALAEIKADPTLKRIPVVVLTTSHAEPDVLKAYELGVSSYITKPVSFEDLVEVARVIQKYWFKVVQLPVQPEPAVG